MSFLRRFARGFRALSNRSAVDRDLSDEIDHFVEQAAAIHIANGVPRETALRAARLELGGVTNVSEQMRRGGWEHLVQTTIADLRYAARRLRSTPAFTLVTVLTLALGVGAATAIFSAVNPILFESLPYPAANRLVMIWEMGDDGARIEGTFGMHRGLSERSRSFEGIAAVRSWQPTLTGTERPERYDGQRVSASYFSVLGRPPAIGRGFLASEDLPGGPNVAVLSDRLWRGRFGADPAIVGSVITLDDVGFEVVGVMPPDFENVLAPSAALWTTLQYDMSQGRAWGHHLRLVGRLRPGITLRDASRELQTIANDVLREQRPETYGSTVSIAAISLQDDVTRGVRPALVAIIGAVVLLLLVACVNVTNLLLARGVQRRGEFALRAAMGAGRGRLVRQMLTESLVLALVGGGVGMLVATLGVRALVALSPPELPRVTAIELNGTVLAFGLLITTLIGVAFGLAPALQAVHADVARDVHHTSRRTIGGHRRVRATLVVAEVALAMMLLVSSGLLLRSLQRLFDVATGFESRGMLTMQVQASTRRFADDSSMTRFFQQTLDAARRVPSVTAAALTNQLPLSGDQDLFGVHLDPPLSTDPGEVRGTYRYAVSPGYVEAMGIPLRRGRTLTDQDIAGAPPVALISESLARRRLAGTDPIGRRVRIGAPDSPRFTIVGIVGDVKQLSLAANESEAVYVSMSQFQFADNAMSLVVRGRGDVSLLAPSIRDAIWSVDRDQPVVRVATMDALLAASAAERRFALILFEAFALSALVLAAAGIYGVLAGSVAERTREMGVRAALGASRRDILGMVVKQGMTLTGVGTAVGAAGAAAATQAIVAMLFGVSPLDPVTYLGVVALLAGVALIACAVPAWRAARIDPASTLRSD
jgi:putative ABC transport system permease protein